MVDEKDKKDIEDITDVEDLDIDNAVSEESEGSVLEDTKEKVVHGEVSEGDVEPDALEKAMEDSEKAEAAEEESTNAEVSPQDDNKSSKKVKKKKEKKQKVKKAKPKGERTPKKWPVIVAAVVMTALVTAAAVLGVLYYFDQKEEVVEPEEVVTEEPQEQVEEPAETQEIVFISSEVGLNLRKEPNTDSEVLAIIPFGVEVPVLAEEDGWIQTEYDSQEGWISADFTTDADPLVYENETYGFQLTFKPSWAGYKFFETSSSEGTAVAGYYVAIPTNDASWKEVGSVPSGYASLFAMGIYTKAEWAKIEGTEGPKPAKLGEGDKYVYTYLPGQARPSDLALQYNEIKEIIDTFEVLK